MEFRVLGPLTVLRNGEQVDAGGPRQQIVLSMLLLAAPRVVSVDALVDALWPQDPPSTARHQVQICISRLRQVLGSGPDTATIRTQAPGYALSVETATVDLHEFERVLGRLRSQPAEASVEALTAGLAMWHGEPLAGIDSPTVRDAAIRLAARRTRTVVQLADLLLGSGRPADAVELLVGEVDREPLHEQLRALLMLALHRCGRQGDALREYQRARTVAGEELGLDPGQELRRLEQAILRDDPAIAAPSTPPPQPIPDSTATEDHGPPGSPDAVPRMLPAPVADFTGRERSVQAVLDALVDRGGDRSNGSGAVPVVVVCGPGGVGKSVLAAQVAHRLADRFPDGQLFATMHAATQPLRPTQVLERFLRMLGVPSRQVPDELEERAEVFRQRLVGRRVLVVLDDIAAAAQVLPLLPPDAGSAALLTSRRRVTALSGARRVALGTFRPSSAVALLGQVAGAERVAAEPEAARDLARLCGYLPLAVRIAAARLAARPHWSLATMVERLSDAGEQLNELSHEDLAVRATLQLAYGTLDPQARRLLRMLAMVDAPDVGGWAAGALLDMSDHRAQDLLGELVEVHFVAVTVPRTAADVGTRYRLHDLVRLFARERAAQEDPTRDREAAIRRYLGALMHLLDTARRREYGDYLTLRGAGERVALDERTELRLLAHPMRWLDAEHHALVSAVEQASAVGANALCWNLATSAVTLFEARAHFDEWRKSHVVALAAARQAEDVLGIAAVRYSLGSLALTEQHLPDAAGHLDAAMDGFVALGHRQGVGMTQRHQAIVARLQGDPDRARTLYEQAHEVFVETGDRVGEAHALNGLAQLDIDAGDDAAALDRLRGAAQICATMANARVGAQVAHRLGEIHLRSGRLADADEAFADVLRFAEEACDPIGEIYGRFGVAMVLAARHSPQAAPAAARAAGLAGERGQQHLQVRALVLASTSAQATGAVGEARSFAEQAVLVADQLGPVPLLQVARSRAVQLGVSVPPGRPAGCPGVLADVGPAAEPDGVPSGTPASLRRLLDRLT